MGALVGAAAALPPGESAPPPPLKVVTYGDSITNGYGSSDGLGYRRELSALLNLAGVEHTIHNESKNGGTTADLLVWARTVTAEHQPDIVVLAIGTNDAVQSAESLRAFEGRYAQLLVEILHGWSPTHIIACFIQPSAVEWFIPRQKAVNDAIFRQATPGVGPHGNRILGPVDFQALASYVLVDGVHPGDRGYDIMGFLIYQTIAQHLGIAS